MFLAKQCSQNQHDKNSFPDIGINGKEETVNNKMVLVTGGGAGIGAAIAERFVEKGAKVCITGRRKEPIEAMLDKLPSGSATLCVGDVSKVEDAERMVRTALEFGGRLDVLVNNAGISIGGSVADIDPEVWHTTMGVNLTGPFLMMRAVIPHFITAGSGSIINISSVGGTRSIPKAPSYCTSKSGLIALTQQVALDYGPMGIRCNVICPGMVRTEMLEHEMGAIAGMMGVEAAGLIKRLEGNLPVGKMAEPRDITGLCLFLASDESSFMTGATLVIDGGGSLKDATLS